MDFTMTDEQVLLRDTARALLTKHCPMSLVRAHIEDPSAADPLWEQLQDWVELANGPLVDLCVFLEECGAVLAPGPFLPTVLAARFLPIDGSATVALAGRDGHWIANDEPTKTFVLEADRVDQVIAVSSEGVSTAVVTDVRQVGSVDWSRRIFDVDLRAGTNVAIAPARIDDWLERAWVAVAAELLGTARWLLHTTIEYAKQRVQFDVPIGSFQAIQHKLANMSLAVERAVSATYYAAMAIDADDPDRHRAAHVAKAAAGRAATLCAKDGIQIHGGIGYTWEHEEHLFYKRAKRLAGQWGDAAAHRARIAELTIGG
jgi:hypothetical protein